MRSPKHNTRLWTAMQSAGLTFEQLAERVNVNTKTAQRWRYEGRIPRRATADRVARCLGVELAWLWPGLTGGRLNDPNGSRDLFELYPYAAGLPDGSFRELVLSAKRELSISTGSEWLLATLGASRAEVPGDRAAGDVVVRLLVSPAITRRGLRELGLTDVEVRTHADVGESSVVRADESMLVVCGGLGLEAASTPVLYLGRTTASGAFDRYAQGFERLWQQSGIAELLNQVLAR